MPVSAYFARIPSFGPTPQVSTSHRKSHKVIIANPVSGCGFTSLKHAQRYIRRGRARLLSDGRLEFIPASYQHQSAASASRRVLFHGGLATIGAVKGLPVAGDPTKLLMGNRSHIPDEWDVPNEHPSKQPLKVTDVTSNIVYNLPPWPTPH